MVIRRSKRHRKKQKTFFYNALVFFIVTIIVAIIIDARLRPIIKTMSSSQAQMYATRAINIAIDEQMEKEGITYEKLVTLTKNEQGDITSLQANMININSLRAHITQAVIEKMMEIEEQKILIPVGTLIGGQLLSGRGPRIVFKVIPASSANSEIYNSFDSAGINQTRHQIMLRLSTRVSAIIPGYSATTEVVTGVCLAETIIVGTVPQAITQVETIDGDFEEKRANYAAEPIE